MRVMGRIFFLLLFSLFFVSGCSVKYKTVVKMQKGDIESVKLSKEDRKKLKNLKRDLISLSSETNKAEAQKLAYIAVTYPVYLAKKYSLVYPPQFHNFLVNIRLRDKGLCYQWVEDMMRYIKCKKFKTFDFHWAVANRGKLNEHNVIVVTAKNRPFESGILLDAWRNSGRIFWTKVVKDKDYSFKEWKSKSRWLSSYGCIP